MTDFLRDSKCDKPHLILPMVGFRLRPDGHRRCHPERSRTFVACHKSTRIYPSGIPSGLRSEWHARRVAKINHWMWQSLTIKLLQWRCFGARSRDLALFLFPGFLVVLSIRQILSVPYLIQSKQRYRAELSITGRKESVVPIAINWRSFATCSAFLRMSLNEKYKSIRIGENDSVYCCGMVIGVVEQ